MNKNLSAFVRRVAMVGALAALALVPAAGAGAAPPAQPGAPQTTSKAPVVGRAQGTLGVHLDFSTLSARPAGNGTRCVLSADATLVLAGSVQGTATGTTTATINAPCAVATSERPGTFSDTFGFTGTFEGTVLGAPVTAGVRYGGATRPGGQVSAILSLTGGARVVAAVRAEAGVGGTYQGTAVVPRQERG